MLGLDVFGKEIRGMGCRAKSFGAQRLEVEIV